MRNHFRRIAFPASLVVLMLFAAAPSYGSLTAPVATAPTNGGTFDTLPGVRVEPGLGRGSVRVPARRRLRLRVDLHRRHDQERARDADRAAANGTYYWHVRAVNATGTAQSGWSATRSIVLNWSDVATPQSPTHGASLTYPQPVLLQLGGRAVRAAVLGQARQRRRPQHPGQRVPGDHQRDGVLRRPRAADHRHVLLERHAARRPGPSGHPVAGLPASTGRGRPPAR